MPGTGGKGDVGDEAAKSPEARAYLDRLDAMNDFLLIIARDGGPAAQGRTEGDGPHQWANDEDRRLKRRNAEKSKTPKTKKATLGCLFCLALLCRTSSTIWAFTSPPRPRRSLRCLPVCRAGHVDRRLGHVEDVRFLAGGAVESNLHRCLPLWCSSMMVGTAHSTIKVQFTG